jgi:hypothetical protein
MVPLIYSRHKPIDSINLRARNGDIIWGTDKPIERIMSRIVIVILTYHRHKPIDLISYHYRFTPSCIPPVYSASPWSQWTELNRVAAFDRLDFKASLSSCHSMTYLASETKLKWFWLHRSADTGSWYIWEVRLSNLSPQSCCPDYGCFMTFVGTSMQFTESNLENGCCSFLPLPVQFFIHWWSCVRCCVILDSDSLVESKLCYRLSFGQSILVSNPYLGPKTRFLLLWDSCVFVHVGHTNVMGGQVCCLQLFLTPCTVILGSESSRAYIHILLFIFETHATCRARSLHVLVYLEMINTCSTTDTDLDYTHHTSVWDVAWHVRELDGLGTENTKIVMLLFRSKTYLDLSTYHSRDKNTTTWMLEFKSCFQDKSNVAPELDITNFCLEMNHRHSNFFSLIPRCNFSLTLYPLNYWFTVCNLHLK